MVVAQGCGAVLIARCCWDSEQIDDPEIFWMCVRHPSGKEPREKQTATRRWKLKGNEV